MRVGMLTSVGDRCGIACYTAEMVKALRDTVEVEVVPITPGRQSDDHYAAQAEVLNQQDVVHIQHEHSFWGGFLPGHSGFWNLRNRIRKPVVLTAHTTTSVREMLRPAQARTALRRVVKEALVRWPAYRMGVELKPFTTGLCIVHTEEGREELVQRGADPKRIHVIPAGVPPPLPAPTGGDAIRKEFGLDGNRVVSLFGFITMNKGYELTIDALPKLPDDVVFLIAGGLRTDELAGYPEQLLARAESLGVRDRVVVTGYLPDERLADVMAASDVVVTPHTRATGSYSVMVPLAYGKPIVSSDLAVFREIQERGDCLRLFPSGDLDAYRQALSGMLCDESGRRELAERAEAYSQSFGWPAIANRTIEVYERAIANAG